MWQQIPPPIRLLLAPLLWLVLIMGGLRLGFGLWFELPTDPVPTVHWWQALYLGAKFDLRVALLLLTPLAILGWIPWLSPLSRFGRWLWSGYFVVAVAALLLLYIVDFGHYAYLGKRVDYTVLRFAADPLISAQMVWQSYPVVPLAVGLLLLLGAIGGWSWRHLGHYASVSYQPLPLLKRSVLISATVLLYFFAIYGKVSWYPLRWSDAFFTPHPFVGVLASNPAVYFVYSVNNGGTPFDEQAARQAYPMLADYLGVDRPDPDSDVLRYHRQVEATPLFEQPPNVVIVVLESFASFKTGLAGNALQPTPHFDQIAAQGIYFPNFFTPHTGTARSMFALMTAIADVQPNETASRNPTIASQQMIVNAFEGYEKFYFLGGSASWGNIRALFSNNIADITLYEEGSYNSPAVDVWGISDLDLFREANAVFSRQRSPFFAVVQTSGNHRPYTIPKDSAGFERLEPEVDVTEHGFISVEEFNAYRFMDHAIGHWMALAQQQDYFDNTLFLFFGDHGLNHEGGQHTHRQESQLTLGSYRVPLVLYAPGELAPQRREIVASEVDIMTTLAAITGHNHLNTTLGRNLFDSRYDSWRYAFTIEHHNPARIGLIGESVYYKVDSDGRNGVLHPLQDENPRGDISAEAPELAAMLKRLTLGYYETARYLLNHNPPVERESARR
ncbi:LTA synthase family protein [Ectothiorhodospiraceae bacterium BW-2]|nr:LTA synthase family protein [Ectothiorhodospiraceae bacterium BW-2]